ncbi:MAG TPA: AMP-binding protein, partial [Acidimicrobiales bacterium]|nr:AMP-binding protein [Acidimicrobiales bacterium]
MSEHSPEEVAARMARRLAGMGLSVIAGDDPDRPAVLTSHGDRTFGELNGRANQLARFMRGRGFTAGDSLAFVMSNRPEFAEVLYAGFRTGARITTINWHLTGEEIAYIVRDCGAKVLVGDAR